MVNEELLWVLWQNLLFSVEDLRTTSGESIIVKRTGTLNPHAGPDFNLAWIGIDGIEWCGDIEVHTKASDWNRHKHSVDAAYESVILHVVYDADTDITRTDGTRIPVLELKNRIEISHLNTYRYLMENQAVVPCAHAFSAVKPIVIEQMKQRVLIERLERKTEALFLQLKKQPDWKNVAGKLIFKSFGTGLNDFLFERMAQHIDFNKLDRLTYAPKSIEALFFGLAGMLDGSFHEAYPNALAKEFAYIKRTLAIESVVNISEWKFLRTRPTNFPTIRLVQLAGIFSQREWYHCFTEICDFKSAHKFLTVESNAYWNNHYRFDQPTHTTVKRIGAAFTNTFLINASIPYLVLRARYMKSDEMWDNVFQFIDLLKAEDNVITRKWVELGMKMKSGFDSQSALELYKMYCTHKKCLSCSIGFSILRDATLSAAVM